MSDAERRRELEELQALAVALTRTLAERPQVPPEQPELEKRIAALEADLALVAGDLPRALRRELAARDALDTRDGARTPWWQLHPGAAVGLAVAAVPGAWLLANWSLDHVNWPWWADRLGPWFLAAPLVLNGLRLLRVAIRDSWRRPR